MKKDSNFRKILEEAAKNDKDFLSRFRAVYDQSTIGASVDLDEWMEENLPTKEEVELDRSSMEFLRQT